MSRATLRAHLNFRTRAGHTRAASWKLSCNIKLCVSGNIVRPHKAGPRCPFVLSSAAAHLHMHRASGRQRIIPHPASHFNSHPRIPRDALSLELTPRVKLSPMRTNSSDVNVVFRKSRSAGRNVRNAERPMKISECEREAETTIPIATGI